MIPGAWRQNLKLWLPAALFFAVTVAFLGIFAFKFADEAEVARSRLERRSEELDLVRSQRERAQGSSIRCGRAKRAWRTFTVDAFRRKAKR